LKPHRPIIVSVKLAPPLIATQTADESPPAPAKTVNQVGDDYTMLISIDDTARNPRQDKPGNK
jgi:hypothetical protein